MSYFSALTLVHTLISLLAIATGVAAIVGLFKRGSSPAFTQAFLVTALATSITGYAFPISGVTPANILGVVALIVLAIVLLAYYRFHVVGVWRPIYAVGMVASLYLLVFVAVAQAFQKIDFLHELAPTQSELPFVIAQVVTLICFIEIGYLAARKYKPDIGYLAGAS